MFIQSAQSGLCDLNIGHAAWIKKNGGVKRDVEGREWKVDSTKYITASIKFLIKKSVRRTFYSLSYSTACITCHRGGKEVEKKNEHLMVSAEQKDGEIHGFPLCEIRDPSPPGFAHTVPCLPDLGLQPCPTCLVTPL